MSCRVSSGIQVPCCVPPSPAGRSIDIAWSEGARHHHAARHRSRYVRRSSSAPIRAPGCRCIGGRNRNVFEAVFEMKEAAIEAALSLVAGEADYKASPLPQLNGLSVGELGSFPDCFLVVSALYYARGSGDVTVRRGNVEAIVRHGGFCPSLWNVNRYHIPESPSVH
jgi:hypothetical protein